MYSFQGLDNWELVFVSGLTAVCMLTISGLIGFLAAHLILRQPAPVVQPLTSANTTSVGAFPQPVTSVDGSVDAVGNRTMVMG